MRRFPIRWGLFAAAVLTFSVGTVAVFPPEAASAATEFSTYTGQGNLTVLPSTAKTLFTGVSDASPQGQVGQYLYAAMKDPKKMAALTQLYKQAQAGTATTAELAELSTAVRASAPIATRTALLTRGVATAAGGPVGLALTSAQIGFMVGGGVSRAMGLDVNGTLCRGGIGGKALAVVSGTDCDTFWDTANKAEANSDVKAGTVGSTVCASDGGCAKWTGSIVDSYQRPYQLFSLTDSANVGGGGIRGKINNKYLMVLYTDPGHGPNSYGQANFTNAVQGKPYYDFCGDADACGYVQPCAVQGCKGAPDFISTITGYQWWNASTDKPDGDVAKLTSGTGDPKRFQRCQQDYKSGRSDTLSGDSRSLSEGMPQPPELPVPPGEIVTKITCELISEDGTAEPVKDFEQETTPEYQKSAAVNPECGSTTVCELQLVKPNGSVCDDTDNPCIDWQEASDSDQYTCRWGNDAIGFKPSTECDWYANRWNPEKQASGNTLTAPSTVSPSGKPSEVPNPAPSKTPGTKANAGSTPADDATDMGPNECFQNMAFTLNPISWVVQPFKCMFIARKGYPESIQKQTAKQWAKKAPAQLSAAMTAWDIKTPADGCNGIPVDMTVNGPASIDWHTRLMASCPGDTFAPFAPFGRLFVGVSITIAVVFALTRYVGALFGFEPFARTGDAS